MMSRTGLLLAASGIAALLRASPVDIALAQGASPSPDATAPTQQVDSYAGDEPTVETAPTTELPILYVTAVEVIRTATEPRIDIVRVTGLAASKGWSFPQLVPTSARSPSDGILDLELIATTPDQTQEAEGFVPVSAFLVLAPGDPYKGVRVHGSANAVQLKSIPGSSVATINVNDCHDCTGKQFVAEGHAPVGQADVVRQEDLPKHLRVITPSSGIVGEQISPNRLSLLLGENNTIVEAFWE
jgi:hypothetical protein